MARYIVQGPDGKQYIVEGPGEGSQAPVQPGSTQGPATHAPAAPDPSQGYVRAGEHGPIVAGIGDSAIKSYLGLKQFAGGLDTDEKGVLSEMKKDVAADPHGFQRGAGDVFGNILQTALPSSWLTKGALGTKALTAIGPVKAAILANAGSAAVLGAATAPGEGDTYGQQMLDKGKEGLKAGATAGVLSGITSKLAQPFRPTEEAKKLMDQGVYPTLAQGADSAPGRFVGGLTSGVLPTATRQNEEVVQAYLKRIIPHVDTTKMSTSERAGLLQSVLSGEYDNILQGKNFQLTPTARKDIWKAAQRAAGREPDVLTEVNSRMGDAGNAMRTGNNVRMSADSLRRQLDYIQDQINRVSRDPSTKAGEVKRGLIAAKETIQKLVRDPALSPDELSKLHALDARYSDSLRFMDAAEGVGAQQQMKVADLLRGYKNLDPKGGRGFATAEAPMQHELLEPAVRTMGLAPNQDEARALMVAAGRAGLKTAGGAAANVVAPGLAAPVYATSLLGQTKVGSRALFGDYGPQKVLADLLRQGKLPVSATGEALSDLKDYQE